VGPALNLSLSFRLVETIVESFREDTQQKIMPYFSKLVDLNLNVLIQVFSRLQKTL